ncbi:MAG: ABC transporter permease [Geminicoccaceae bacterium]|nr:MAG: ABC transporter permease [Geminicoccaceae bacterium]
MDGAFLQTILLFDSTIRLATPLILAALAGLFAERSGIADIGLEGKMLGAAFAAAATAAVTGDAWLGLLSGILVGIAASLLHGFACITHNGNQIVSGVAINIVIAGLAPTLADAWFGQAGRTPSLSGSARFPSLELPFAEALAPLPILGPLYSVLISGHNILVYVAAFAVPLTWYVLYKTRFGLRLRAVGEHPEAVDTAGISVTWLRYQAMICTGALCGVAGTYLSTAHGAGFIRDMTAGKGFLALAALIFGKWRPVPALLACLLFAFADAVQVRLQGVDLPLIGRVPTQAIQALPYVLTVLLLAGFVGRAVAPRAIGRAYDKERTGV